MENFEPNSPQFIDIAINEDSRGKHIKFFGNNPDNIFVPRYSVAEAFITVNNKNALRGMHFQRPPQPKLIQVITGAIKGNVICCDPEHPSFGNSMTYELDENSTKKIFIPGMWSNGYRALTENTRVLYLAGSDFFSPGDIGIDPFDQELNLDWGPEFNKDVAIMAERDKNLQSFNDFKRKLSE